MRKRNISILILAAFFFVFCGSIKSEAVPTFRPVDLWIEAQYHAIQKQLEAYVKNILTNIEDIASIKSLGDLQRAVDSILKLKDQMLDLRKLMVKEDILKGLFSEIENSISTFPVGEYLMNGTGGGMSGKTSGENLQKALSDGKFNDFGHMIASRAYEIVKASIRGSESVGTESKFFSLSVFSSSSGAFDFTPGSGIANAEEGAMDENARRALEFLAKIVPLSMPDMAMQSAYTALHSSDDPFKRDMGITAIAESAVFEILSFIANEPDFHEETWKAEIERQSKGRERQGEHLTSQEPKTAQEATVRQMLLLNDQQTRSTGAFSNIAMKLSGNIRMRGVSAVVQACAATSENIASSQRHMNLLDNAFEHGTEETKQKVVKAYGHGEGE